MNTASDFTIREGVLESYQGSASHVTIPAGVRAIAPRVFMWHKEIRHIELPNSITRIGEWAFCGCQGLRSIELPPRMTVLEVRLFYGCEQLSQVRLPARLHRVKEDAFLYCTALERIELPAGVTRIDRSAFQDCIALRDVVLPEGLRTIGARVFGDCSALEHIELPDSVTSIGPMLFAHCIRLHSVTLPKGLTHLPDAAFMQCTGLKELHLPAAVTTLGGAALMGCTGLESITLPDGLTRIGENAFRDCRSLRRAELPPTVLSISARAFAGCTSLEPVDLPDSVTVIGEKAFQGSSRCIESVDGVEYLGRWAVGADSGITAAKLRPGTTALAISTFAHCAQLTEAILPEGVAEVSVFAFLDCPALRRVVLPASLTEFNGFCENLEEIVLPGGLSCALDPLLRQNSVKRICALQLDISAFPSSRQKNLAALGYALLDILNVPLPEAIRAGYEERIRRYQAVQRELLRAAVTDARYTGFVCARRLIPLKDFDLWFEKASAHGDPAVLACLLESRDTAFTPRQRAAMEERRLSLREPTVTELKEQWNVRKKEDGTLEIRSYKGEALDVTVPERVGRALVTGIGPRAFSPLGQSAPNAGARRQLHTVTLPDTVTEIGRSAFEGCTALEHIRLPAGLARLDRGAFFGCIALTDIELPSGLTELNSETFGACRSLHSIYIPASVRAIANGAFLGCRGVKVTAQAGSCGARFAVRHNFPLTTAWKYDKRG